MCGFVGFWAPHAVDPRGAEATVDAMSDTLRHRGPDDAGRYVDAAAGLALGHRRLSILDLSPEGHQPMASPSGRWWVAYNGEIYNHDDLRAELGISRWRGHSDTEVLVAALDRWGVDGTLPRLNGMFALAAWDAERRALWLARDRLGIKPLYWGHAGGTLLFGSELKALAAHPGFDAGLDRAALAAYFRYNVVPGPHSIYRGVHKLSPGHLVRLTSATDDAATPSAWWSAATAARGAPFEGSFDEATDALEALLTDAVRQRMVADVPLGAFLSGGIDSSTIVALMQSVSDRPVRTFTIGFTDGAYDEATDAHAVAAHLGTDHTELILEPDAALDVIASLPTMYDEPFSDSSQIPTHLVSRLAREHVTVALSGDGGDELFGGYNRHFWGPRLWRRLRRVPRFGRRAAARGLRSVSPARWDQVFQGLDPVLPGALRARTPGDKVHKLASILPSASPGDMYRTLCSHWKRPLELVHAEAEAEASQAAGLPDGLGFAEQMMWLDLRTYLPDDILTKVDRASMAVSLEARVPLLDHRVVELAWSLPLAHKIEGGVGKRVLRAVLDRHVPRALIDRPKMGFGVPIDRWLRGPLRDWAADLLDPGRMAADGVLRPEPVQALWASHQGGSVNAQHHLWDVLMFQAWWRAQSRDRVAGAAGLSP